VTISNITKKGALLNFAMGAVLHRYATDCELLCRNVKCVLLHYFNGQPYIFCSCELRWRSTECVLFSCFNEL